MSVRSLVFARGLNPYMDLAVLEFVEDCILSGAPAVVEVDLVVFDVIGYLLLGVGCVCVAILVKTGVYSYL